MLPRAVKSELTPGYVYGRYSPSRSVSLASSRIFRDIFRDIFCYIVEPSAIER